jgi:predicted deacylase
MREEKYQLKSFTPGLKREITIWRFSSDHENTDLPKIYLQASLHADEIPPMLVINHLKEKLLLAEKENLLKAHFILIPQANPIGGTQFIGTEHFGRYDLTTFENFNRKFFDFYEVIKDSVEKNLTEDANANIKMIKKTMLNVLDKLNPKTELEDLRITLLKLSIDADLVLDLHCDFDGPLHIYTGTPIFEEIKPLPQFLGSSAQLIAMESGGNPFDEAVTKIWWQLRAAFPKFPIPSGTLGATIELRGKCDVNDNLASMDAENLFQYFVYSNFIIGKKLTPPKLIREATELSATQFVEVDATGILIFKISIGDWIKKDDLIADVMDPLTGKRTPVLSEVDGQFLTKTLQRYCYAGMYIGKVVGDKAYRTGSLLSAK